MRRREFITLLGGAAVAWPTAARAQQASVPVIGYLYAGSRLPVEHLLAQFRQSLAEAGYVEGQNVMIDYRFAEGHYDQLPELAADLVRRQVTAIVIPNNSTAALAAKAATATIPIVFSVSDDPVKFGLVASLGRPGGNATGVNFLAGELGAKRLGLLREFLPAATRVGLLINPNNPNAEAMVSDTTVASTAAGITIDIVHARDSREIEGAFTTLVRNKVDALVVGADTIFNNRRVQVVTLAMRYAIPAIYSVREYAEVGGLMSYGTGLIDVYRQLGVYTGRILKGAKPADLPVAQSTKFDLVINLPTARALGLTIPPKLLFTADEVIE